MSGLAEMLRISRDEVGQLRDALNEARTLARIFYTTAPVTDEDRQITYERYPWLAPDGPD